MRNGPNKKLVCHTPQLVSMVRNIYAVTNPEV